MQKNKYSISEKSLAWAVHLFTATGLFAGFLAILSINERDWRTAMFWLFVALVIDGVDGTIARWFKVKKVLPKMNGTTIDFVVDFVNYAVIPAYLFYSAELVPMAWNLPCTAIILLVSALYYGKVEMVSEDMYFIGFPVLWNLVVFYLIFIFQFPPIINVVLVVFFAILHFIPIKYAYPSQATKFRVGVLIMSAVYLIVMLLILNYHPERHAILSIISCIIALSFGVLAIYNTYFESKD